MTTPVAITGSKVHGRVWKWDALDQGAGLEIGESLKPGVGNRDWGVAKAGSGESGLGSRKGKGKGNSNGNSKSNGTPPRPSPASHGRGNGGRVAI